jgi:hypothetical protein
MDFQEFCREKGWDIVSDPVTHAARQKAWNDFIDAYLKLPMPPTLNRGIDGTITRTWMQDREQELARRHPFRCLLWPTRPLPILRRCIVTASSPTP